MKFDLKKPASLVSMLITLTLLAIITQVTFFIIHYRVSDLVDSLVQSSLKSQMLHPVILLPLLGFLLTQIISYSIFVAWTWFITISIKELFKLSSRITSWLGIVIWLVSSGTILCLNNYFFPDSFFAKLIPLKNYYLTVFLSILLLLTLFAYTNFFWHKRHLKIGSAFLLFLFTFASFAIYEQEKPLNGTITSATNQPNIILIGLDSVRPDYINEHTPFINDFLNQATIFTQAYTPLARTFTGWMSILTGQYPKHNNARTNLADPDLIHADETLAKRLRDVGYETMYGTDEKRFSNITERYGFDHIIGPDMGVNDFILGSLTDFPLTNLMINSSLGRFLFPFNFANRAAAITYEPDSFMQLVKLGLEKRSDKPLFLCIHLCVSHWPYTWARDKQAPNFIMPQRYESSVIEVDRQLGELMAVLKKDGLLKNSLVILLSDHGTTLGLANDRSIRANKYFGDPAKKNFIPKSKLSSAPEIGSATDFSVSTSYGQGTDALSLKQYHILLAFKGFGVNTTPGQFDNRVMLMDIAPTILEFLNLSPLKTSDGISLHSYLIHSAQHPDVSSRALFMETGYSIPEIQTNHISAEKVLKHAIVDYQINPTTGLLFVKPGAENAMNANRQRAIFLGNWLLVRFPEMTRHKFMPDEHSSQMTYQAYKIPPFFVIVNTKTGEWGIDLDSPLAKKAPMNELMKQFNGFYGDEV